MIERDWNRPSIVIWGVRINESQDDHDLYAETNRLARELDPTRQTGGVRYITDSEMLEDVYTMNDFVLGEHENPMTNRPRMGLRSQRETTGLKAPVPYLVTEYNGHMFPTKAGDQESRMAEHAIRHLEVLDAAFGGSALKLVVQALGHQRTSQAELDQIRALLNEMEQQKGTTEKGGTDELA